MLAYDYPLNGIFWTTVYLAFWATFFYLFFWVARDVLRSPDLGGLGKVAWLIAVLIVPFVGAVGYVVFRGHAMSEREFREARERRQQSDAAGTTRSWPTP